MLGPSKKELRRIRELLLEGRDEQVAEGLDLCAAFNSPATAPILVEALSRGVLVGSERVRGLALLADLHLAYPLDDVRADGWLDRFGEGVAGFREACELIGRTFLGMAAILGIHVTSIEVRPKDFQRSLVVFALDDDDRPQSLTLREFKRRVVSQILEARPALPAVKLPLDRDRVISLLGSHHILLAALFDWSLMWVYFSRPPRDLSEVHIDALHGGEPVTLTLDMLIGRLHQEVEEEWRHFLDPLGGIDAEAIRRASELLPTDPGRAAHLVGGLLQFVLDYGRHSARSAPDPSVLALVCEGLAVLARAHLASTAERGCHGEELLRLGVQVFPGVSGVEHLHLALGEHLVNTAREGEAIGHLRRAAALGAPADTVEPLLVEALFRSERVVAAAAIYRQLAARSPHAAERISRPTLDALRTQAAAVFSALEGDDHSHG